ncbi:LLM class flavin-dependent oxidoreductase [Gordonia desulfuricans]|uniref:LLM class flavin-dependent oxidoreductase n=1 Tax=Gordonia desulfuricans TaxID=89051 RepID=A0A7K3LUC6_9ACTN|nr:LLM class flavin-dependent oxidoreductase [Gordonia desulfuricans]
MGHRVGHGEHRDQQAPIDNDLPVAQAYREAIEIFVAAEELGYDSGWVIQRHFRQGKEQISSPLVALGAIAQHTTRIGLGTGVLVLPLEDPLRVAEDAATVDAFSGGRLELGVGSGPFPGAWEAFGRDLADRQRIFGESVSRLHEVLEGSPLNAAGESLYSPGAGVRRRLWQATTSHPDYAHASAAAAALAGDGLQLSRANAWGGGTVAGAQAAQAAWIRSYLSAWTDPDHPPRVQVSRAVYPHPDRVEAVRRVTPGVHRWRSWSTSGGPKHAQGVDEYLAADHALLGPAATLADELAADPAVALATDLLVSFVPGVPDRDEHIRLLESTARDLAPRLGCAPSERGRP